MQRVSGQLYEYLQSVQAYLAPPMTAVFFLGVFWKRMNGKGAVATLLLGFTLGLAKLGCQIYAQPVSPEEMDMLTALQRTMVAYGNINFLHFCVYLFLFCCATLTVVSLFSAPPSAAQIENLTYATNTADGRKEVRDSWNRWDVVHTAVVLLIILSVYVYFTG